MYSNLVSGTTKSTGKKIIVTQLLMIGFGVSLSRFATCFQVIFLNITTINDRSQFQKLLGRLKFIQLKDNRF